MNRIIQALLKLATIVAAIAFIAGCETIYTSPDFSIYESGHESIAILPFDVTINPGHKSKDVTQDELRELATKQGETFQRALYSQFLQGQQRGKYTVTFQDIDETNVLLNRELERHATRRVLSALTKSEICEILKVDAVVSGDMALSKPMGTGAAIASALLLGIGGATNEGHINMSIHEGDGGKLLWNYEHKVKGNLLSSPESVAKDLMKGVARTFPYKR